MLFKMLIDITLLALFCTSNAFFLKDDEHSFQDLNFNSSFNKDVDFEHSFDIIGSDPCSCKNGRCVKDNRGQWKCMCLPRHSLKGKNNCELCDCGSKGKCIFTETFSEETRSIQYEKKCVCDTGYADRYGTCTECVCGVNSKCEFEYGDKNCYCVEGYAELNGVCTECNCGEGGYCEFQWGEKNCTCYDGYLFNGHTCAECYCGDKGKCYFEKGVKMCDCEAGFADQDGICTATCYKDEDCNYNEKCAEEDGWRTCKCADGLSGDDCERLEWCENGKFKDCYGEHGTCTYDKDKRTVDCKCDFGKDLHPLENRCRVSCFKDEDCNDNQKCVTEEDGWMTCVCANGLSGENCEKLDWCENNAKFKHCKGENGTCEYVKEKRAVDCVCDYGKELHPLKNRCSETCDRNEDCQNFGECVVIGRNNFCSCRSGLSGDRCQTVLDCISDGKYKDCEKSGGQCSYDIYTQTTACNCVSDNKAFDDRENICKDCNCGPEGECRFEYGEKKCYCRKGFAVKDGICTATCYSSEDCNENERCFEEGDGWRTCVCADGLSGDKCEVKDWCEHFGKFEDCKGENGTCEYSIERRAVVCTCPFGKRLHPYENRCRETCNLERDCQYGGECISRGEHSFCLCKPGLNGDKCGIVVDCEPKGKYENCKDDTGTCTYDIFLEKAVCSCPEKTKLNDKENKCKECDCGGHGECSFENGIKTCACELGFGDLDGTCKETCNRESDCQYGGECISRGEHSFCKCKPGLNGDKCGTVVDCEPEGKFENCNGDAGKCTYDTISGEAVCSCSQKTKLNDRENKCKECDCGPAGTCSFNNGKKECYCQLGFSNKDGKCTACDCGPKGSCSFIDGLKMCECEQGFASKDGRCAETCLKDADCQNGGICERQGENQFCTCESGLSGDNCEIVTDCGIVGKYKGCESSGGTCSYDVSLKAPVCKCPNKKAYQDTEHKCKECDCGENGQCSFVGQRKSCKCSEEYSEKNGKCENCHCGVHGSCAFDNEEKVCFCNKGYSERNGKCEICDCGQNGYCSFRGDEKICKCDGRYAEKDGKCEVCDCGEGGWCAFKDGEKTCECRTGYTEKNGKCEMCDCDEGKSCYFDGKDKNCKCYIGFSERTGKWEICDCGVRGWCYFVNEEKKCKCEDGYAEKNDRCEVCDCGKNTVCQFIRGAKACACIEGFVFNEETGQCEECDCGVGALNCSFMGGKKHCTCANGFAEENGQCKRIKSCEPNPCVHGHCVLQDNDFLCVCDDPFTGRFCEISTCIETKCFGGRCRVIENKEECVCPAGHQLANGNCTKTFCVEKKCYDGECVIQNGVETCICPEGYVSDGNECRKVKCSVRSCVGGTCRIIRGNIEDCVCPIGHVLIDDTCTITTCTPRTCYGGRCEKREDKLVCICPDGFHLEGVGCTETQCKEQNCFGGKCRVIKGEEICTCLDGYVLKNDQCQKARCVEKHCFGGKCDVVDGEEVCSCPVGFEVQGDVCREI